MKGSRDHFWTRHPSASETALVIEVADTTLARDRGIKLRIDARAAIPTYWIVSLIDLKVEVYTNPTAGPEPTYRRRDVYAGGDAVLVPVVGTMVLAADLLPPA